jgi:isopenicillin-N epimerase
MIKDLFLLDPEVAFLNHGSFGACPRPVFEVYQAWQRKLESQPVQFLGQEFDGYMLHSREVLGNYLHTSANNIVYVPNATHGVNIIAHSLKLNFGDEVLTTNHEYGACNYAWDFICQRAGANYRQQAIYLPVASEEEIIDQFWLGVTSHTKVIFLSHITSPTSLTLPVRAICERARNVGIISVIDGAHAPGQLSLDLSTIPCDFYTGNCHKWMLSPKGAGFLYARPEAQFLVQPLVVSWGYQSNFSTPRESIFIDSLQWTGTHDPAAALSVPSAITFMYEHHWDDVRARCHTMLLDAIERICDRTGLAPIYPSNSNFYHQMATIPIPPVTKLDEFKHRLWTDFKVEIPCIEWNSCQFIRLSIQGYNSDNDIDRLINALFSLLPEFGA